MSKIEAGMIRIESAPFSLRGLLRSIEGMLRPVFGEKQLQLSVEVDESIPDTLEGDATRLTQILVNLVGNALKFTTKGTVSISVTREGQSGNIINAGISVVDTGIGIEKEKLKNIFERFKQAEDSVTRKYGGTGLGLSIVKELILLQNGTIEVESEPGIGTTFRIMIPYKISEGKSSSDMMLSDNFIFSEDFEHAYILVAEDNEINQSLIKHLFKHWELKYDLASNGREVIHKLQKKKYDLILMDIQMPEMDGYTTTKEIRLKLKLTIPIIAMTAHAFTGERERCLSYGMNEYISKPIRGEELHKLITQFTLVKTTLNTEKELPLNVPAGQYKYIILAYMKEVSGGNIEYERTVTRQFIETIPGDLLAMENAWLKNDFKQIQHIAHNLKSTIYVMGLNDLLQSSLDTLEYKILEKEDFETNFYKVKSVCISSVEEAKQFYASI